MFVDKKIKRKLKKAILISANISLNKLEKINLKLNKVEIYNNENIKKYIKHISK
jgi:phosphotransacetylase